MAQEKLTYEKAMNRLNAIIAQIEQGEISVDELGDKIQEAKKLFEFCKKKLTSIEQNIADILKDIPDAQNGIS